jgi:hypothetical protein
MDDGDTVRCMRMCIRFGRSAMCGPARVADAASPRQRLFSQFLFEILEFALGAQSRVLSSFQRCNAGGIVTAIFQTLQCIDKLFRDWTFAKYSDNSTHRMIDPLTRNPKSM